MLALVGIHRIHAALGLGRVLDVLELTCTLLIAAATEQARRTQREDGAEERQARDQEPPAGPMSLTMMIHKNRRGGNSRASAAPLKVEKEIETWALASHDGTGPKTARSWLP